MFLALKLLNMQFFYFCKYFIYFLTFFYFYERKVWLRDKLIKLCMKRMHGGVLWGPCTQEWALTYEMPHCIPFIWHIISVELCMGVACTYLGHRKGGGWVFNFFSLFFLSLLFVWHLLHAYQIPCVGMLDKDFVDWLHDG